MLRTMISVLFIFSSVAFSYKDSLRIDFAFEGQKSFDYMGRPYQLLISDKVKKELGTDLEIRNVSLDTMALSAENINKEILLSLKKHIKSQNSKIEVQLELDGIVELFPLKQFEEEPYQKAYKFLDDKGKSWVVFIRDIDLSVKKFRRKLDSSIKFNLSANISVWDAELKKERLTFYLKVYENYDQKKLAGFKLSDLTNAFWDVAFKKKEEPGFFGF